MKRLVSTLRRWLKPKGKMRTLCLLNESTREDVTKPVLESIAHAVYRQLAEHYAPFWEASPPDAFVVAMRKEDVPKGASVISVIDDPDVAGAYGYHYTTDDGDPLARVFTKPILDNGGTLTKGATSLSQTISHEVLEMAGDPYASFWADMGDGRTEESLELCDRVEGDSYEIDGIAVSNFLGPRAFRDGPGPYDWLGKLKSPWDLTPGGYAIRRTGGPAGRVHEVYGHAVPDWKIAVRKKKVGSRGKKRAKVLGYSSAHHDPLP